MQFSARRLETALEGLYTVIEAQPTTLYRLSQSDGWHQARRGEIDGNATEHLETWIGIGNVTFSASAYALELVIHSALRLPPDDDSFGMARIHGASIALMERLSTWSDPASSSRTIPQSYVIEPLSPDGEWQHLQASAILHLQRS